VRHRTYIGPEHAVRTCPQSSTGIRLAAMTLRSRLRKPRCAAHEPPSLPPAPSSSARAAMGGRTICVQQWQDDEVIADLVAGYARLHPPGRDGGRAGDGGLISSNLINRSPSPLRGRDVTVARSPCRRAGRPLT
jgi:hypothetical protein